METITFIENRIEAMNKMLDPKNPLKPSTRLFIWDNREWWKNMLDKHKKLAMVRA
jgi:hypothetical protein